MKIGIVIQHYDARNDIRDLVELLSSERDIVIFGSAEALKRISKGPYELRVFQQSWKLRDLIWRKAYHYFSKLPKSKNNYLITELFKLSVVGSRLRRLFAALMLRARRFLPQLMSFDDYLMRIQHVDRTKVDDIDEVFFITELSDPAFLAHVLRKAIPASGYVYSWDHACKHVRFSERVSKYYVWHNGIIDDLAELQGIDRLKCEVVGATQLSYIWNYINQPSLREAVYPGEYIYYGCGVGHIGMAEQEARLVKFLAQSLLNLNEDLVLLVRPYPMLLEMGFFDEIKRMPNVKFDIGYREERSDRSLSHEDIYHKLNLQEHALAFIHCGTTMGLESAFFDVPVLFLQVDDFDFGVPMSDFYHLSKFIHQYHNDRYMMSYNSGKNVVRRTCDLEGVLESLLVDGYSYRDYNSYVRRGLKLRPLQDIVDVMFKHKKIV